MPYIYTHSEQQRKITVIVICHHRRIWARARVAAAHNARIFSSEELRVKSEE